MVFLIIVVIAVAVGVTQGNKKHNNQNLSSSGGSGSGTNGSSVNQTNPNDPSSFSKDPRLIKSFYGFAYTPEGSQYPQCGNSLCAWRSSLCHSSLFLACRVPRFFSTSHSPPARIDSLFLFTQPRSSMTSRSVLASACTDRNRILILFLLGLFPALTILTLPAELFVHRLSCHDRAHQCGEQLLSQLTTVSAVMFLHQILLSDGARS